MAKKDKDTYTLKVGNVSVKFRELKDGIKVPYLDVCIDGKRHREFVNNSTKGIERKYIYPKGHPDYNLNEENWLFIQGVAINRAKQIKEEGIIKPDVKKSKITLFDWLDTYVGLMATYKDLNHIKTMVSLVKSYPKAKKLLLKDVDGGFIKDFTKYLQYDYIAPKFNKPLSNSSIHKYLTHFRDCFQQANIRGYIQVNPFLMISKTDKVKQDRPNPDTLSIEEVQALIDTPCVNNEVKNAFLFACFVGLRISDIRNLEWGVNLKKDNEGYYINALQVKTKHPVQFRVEGDALRWLPTDKDPLTGKVFNLPNANAIAYDLKKWGKMAKLSQHLHFHLSRHTCASLLHDKGISVYDISKQLGHQSIEITAKYIAQFDAKKFGLANTLNGIFQLPKTDDEPKN